MQRNFADVVEAIIKVAPPTLASKLKESAAFWAPESCWELLGEYVRKYVKPSSYDEAAIAVYSILNNRTESEIIDFFRAQKL